MDTLEIRGKNQLLSLLIIIFILLLLYPYKLKYCDTNEGCFYELQNYLHAYFNIISHLLSCC